MSNPWSEPDDPPRKPRGRRTDAAEPPSGVHRPAWDVTHWLPGAVLMVPNYEWDIPGEACLDHPGIGIRAAPGGQAATLIHGTDIDNIRPEFAYRYLVIEPAPGNGLVKPTAFEFTPRYFRWHRLRRLFPDRYLGHLDEVAYVRLLSWLKVMWGEEESAA